MSTPNITLTATLDDLTGAAIGSASDPAKLRITLCGFGPILPRIAGTSMIAKTGPFDIFSTGSPISTPLWGNDQITPSGTFYTFEILDGDDNVIQCAAYQLTGAGTYDLSQLTPITIAAAITVSQFSIYVNAPTVQGASGTVNGVNRNFTFAAPSSPTPAIAVYAGGIFMTPTTDYAVPTYAGAGIWNLVFTTAPPNAPITIVLFTAPTVNGYIPIAFSATPVFASNGYPGNLIFDITLTANVTSSTMSAIATGQFAQFFIQQDATGGRTFAWPAVVKNAPVVNPTALAVTSALFVMRSDGNLYLA